MQTAEQQIARAASHPLNRGLRALTADEVALITAAVEAGASLRADSAYEEYILGTGGLPVFWATHIHCEDVGNPALEAPAAAERAKMAAFAARCSIGDLAGLSERVQAARVAMAQPQAEAA